MNEDSTEVSDETIRRIREKADEERTGEEQAVLGIDNALTAAKAALEAAGFDLDHLILIFDASASPDKNPDAPLTGMVIVPHHEECAVNLLAASLGSVGEATGMLHRVDVSEAMGHRPPGQGGPIHHQS